MSIALVDPLVALEHTHDQLSKAVMVLSRVVAQARKDISPSPMEWKAFAARLASLHEELLSCFAKEEEGLFPYIREHMPALRAKIDQLVSAHDAMCGILARLSHAMTCAKPCQFEDRALELFERFEAMHIQHARDEAALLHVLGHVLDGPQRVEVAALLEGL